MSEARTEEPTPRRLARARAEGDSGASAYASQAVGLVVAALLVPGAIAVVAGRASSRIREAIATAAASEPGATFDAWRASGDLVLPVIPALLAVAVAAGAAQLAQTGGVLAWPKRGARPVVSRARLLAVARALVGAAVALGVVAYVLRAHLSDLAHVAGRAGYVYPAAATLAVTVASSAAIAGLALAAVDVLVVRTGRRARLRMTRREVERERKESEGDPALRRAREDARQTMLAAATVGRVRDASVVVADGARLACALLYEGDDERGERTRAPVVIASGEGDVAQPIVDAARAYGVPVVQEPALARALAGVAIGDAIPEASYEAVAEVLRGVQEVAAARSASASARSSRP